MTENSGPVFDLTSTPMADGVTVIEASAGTGKTYCLTGLVLRALLEGQVENAGQLLVVTFTNAATDELVGRIRSSLATGRAVLAGEQQTEDEFLLGLASRHGIEGAEILRHALLDIDELTVATIHGFCKRVLDEAAFEGGLPFEASLVESDDAIWLDSSRDVWRRLLASEEIQAADGLLPILIADRLLEPESYREDFRQWRRHPATELIPEPLSITEAAARLAVARRAAAASFDRARWRLALSRMERRAHLADSKELRQRLTAADSFLKGKSSGLWAMTGLDLESLRSAVGRGDRAALEKLPGIAEVTAFFNAIDQSLHAIRGHMLHQVEKGFEQAKQQAATVAFDDLLHQLRRALTHPVHGPRLRDAVRSRYKLALIDEFQDTDLVQYDIFRRLFGRGPLFLVGDPKQAIYRFRGADVYAYLRAKRDSDRTFTLSRNWRSSKPLITAVNAVFGEVAQPFIEQDIPYPPATSAPAAAGRRLVGDDEKAFVWLWLGRETRAARAEERIAIAVAREVAKLLSTCLSLEDDEVGSVSSGNDPGGRALRPADIAVLVRTNQQARLMQDRLREAGVPAVLSRTGDIFHSDELEELLRLLDAVLEPTDGGRLRAACSTVLWGDDAEGLRQLSDDDSLFQSRVDQFSDYRDKWFGHGFVSMMEALLRERGVRQRLAALERGERRLTNLQHAVEIAHQASHDHHLSPSGLIGWLRAEKALGRHDRNTAELRLESDDAAVQLVTVHKSKGLEYEVVFSPFLWQARPVREAPVLVHETAERLLYDCGSERLALHLKMAEAERVAEDLRLLYVALTRARRRTYVVWGAIGRGPMSARSALAYLLHRRQQRLDAPGAPSAIESAHLVSDGLGEAADRHEAWYEDLRRLVERFHDVMAVKELEDDGQAETWNQFNGDRAPLAAASMNPERLVKPWRIASFSSLARGGSHETPDHADPPSPAANPNIRPSGLFAFARGPRAGDCLHKIFESIDFTEDPRGQPCREAVRRQLQRFSLEDPSQHLRGAEESEGFDPENVVVGMLERVLENSMSGGLRLADVARSERLVEWQFYTPLAASEPNKLANIFRENCQAPWLDAYATRLDHLDSNQLEGFLTGYVDVVVHHDGKWSLIDWKSNHLGDRVQDYDEAAMTGAMIDHHYFLQAHLYALALDRFLMLHQPDWDFERQFGGAYYIFLRGVDSETAQVPALDPGQLALFDSSPSPQQVTSSATGIFHLRPDVALIKALGNQLLGTWSPR